MVGTNTKDMTKKRITAERAKLLPQKREGGEVTMRAIAKRVEWGTKITVDDFCQRGFQTPASDQRLNPPKFNALIPFWSIRADQRVQVREGLGRML
jgi:hypothetical protein